MALVRGFTDILCPQNLAVNGSFRINQRGLFTDWTPVKAGDFVGDSWQIRSSTGLTYDFCEVKFDSTNRKLCVRGRGKSGQTIVLDNITQLVSFDSIAEELTASCRVLNVAGVLLQVYPSPPYPSSITTPYTSYALVKSGETKDAIKVIQSGSPTTSRSTGHVQVTLRAEGDFNFEIHSYKVICGQFTSPPLIANVPYETDLFRCKTRYQKGSSLIQSLGRDNGTEYLLGGEVEFPVEMAGTPTPIVTMGVVAEEGSTSDVKANYTVHTANHTSKGFHWYIKKATGGSKPSYVQISWTASV